MGDVDGGLQLLQRFQEKCDAERVARDFWVDGLIIVSGPLPRGVHPYSFHQQTASLKAASWKPAVARRRGAQRPNGLIAAPAWSSPLHRACLP